jgi:hypothetical protein
VRRGSKEAGTAAKNVGVEETDPRRLHFVVTGEGAEIGARGRLDCNGESPKTKIAFYSVCSKVRRYFIGYLLPNENTNYLFASI